MTPYLQMRLEAKRTAVFWRGHPEMCSYAHEPHFLPSPPRVLSCFMVRQGVRSTLPTSSLPVLFLSVRGVGLHPNTLNSLHILYDRSTAPHTYIRCNEKGCSVTRWLEKIPVPILRTLLTEAPLPLSTPSTRQLTKNIWKVFFWFGLVETTRLNSDGSAKSSSGKCTGAH